MTWHNAFPVCIIWSGVATYICDSLVNLSMFVDLLSLTEFCSLVDCVSLSLSSVPISSLLWEEEEEEEEKWRGKLEEHQGCHCSICFIHNTLTLQFLLTQYLHCIMHFLLYINYNTLTVLTLQLV